MRPKAKQRKAKALKVVLAQHKTNSDFFENGVFLGSYSDRRRPDVEWRHKDFRRQERGASTDDRLAAHERNADSGKYPESRRRWHALAHSRPSWRRSFGRWKAAGRPRAREPGDPPSRAPDRRYDGALRVRLQNAGEFLGYRAASRPDGRGQSFPARRLRNRHSA